MKQKLLAGLLVLLFILGTFAGCSQRTNTSSSESSTSQREEESSSQEESIDEQEPPEESIQEPQSDDESQPEDVSEAQESSESQVATTQTEQQIQSTGATFYAYYDFDALSGYGLGRQGRVGTQEELAAVSTYFAGLSADSITTLSASVMPNDLSKDYALSADELAEVVGMLKALSPSLLPEEELGNPYTGGGWTMYIDSPQGRLMCSYGGWFTVAYPDGGDTLIFRADDASDPFLEIDNYIWAKMDGIQ